MYICAIIIIIIGMQGVKKKDIPADIFIGILVLLKKSVNEETAEEVGRTSAGSGLTQLCISLLEHFHIEIYDLVIEPCALKEKENEGEIWTEERRDHLISRPGLKQLIFSLDIGILNLSMIISSL
jgi:hypothetical protein